MLNLWRQFVLYIYGILHLWSNSPCVVYLYKALHPANSSRFLFHQIINILSSSQDYLPLTVKVIGSSPRTARSENFMWECFQLLAEGRWLTNSTQSELVWGLSPPIKLENLKCDDMTLNPIQYYLRSSWRNKITLDRTTKSVCQVPHSDSNRNY